MCLDPPIPNEYPHAEYSRRLEVQRKAQSRYEHQHRIIGNVQLVLAGLALTIFVFALWTGAVSILWVVVPVVAIVLLAIVHARVSHAIKTHLRLIIFYKRALARLEDRWIGTGEPGERFLDTSHPCARDLDLFGKGSLFDLLCTARTRAGEATLARWLLEPTSPEEVSTRQEAVNDLCGRLDLREDLAVLGEDVRSGVRPEVLMAWGEGEPLREPGLVRVAAYALPALWFSGLLAWIGWDIVFPFLIVSLANLGFSYAIRRHVDKVVSPAEEAAQDLALLRGVLARLEREKFSAARLVELQAGLMTNGVVASHSIGKLGRLIERLESRRNLFAKAVDPFLLRTLRLAFAVEAWRSNFGLRIRRWLASVGEMEALCALAGYTYEHPTDVFPEFTVDGPCFEAGALAHPLMAESRAVRNDLRLDRGLQLMIISGPNMAGKSTLVRAVGVDAVLAQCGAPVRARRLRLSRLAVAASICVLDSLHGGISRFYAEISRLKQITELTKGPLPVLFLLDELLQGTNSHDRRTGAEGILCNLFGRGAIGLVTTHDLALTQIAESLGSGAANFHFEDRLENGKLYFDYRLNPGVVQTSNALELMRSIGLEI
jgi:hypothetical protein